MPIVSSLHCLIPQEFCLDATVENWKQNRKHAEELDCQWELHFLTVIFWRESLVWSALHISHFCENSSGPWLVLRCNQNRRGI